MMTAITNVLALLLVAALISTKTKRPLVTAIPTVLCMLMIVLQVLSCVHALSLIDELSIITIVCCSIYFIVNRQHIKVRELLHSTILHPSFIVFVVVILLVVFTNLNSSVSNWDDINYWAASVRALFERDGLEGKYYTVAAGWGDYPLGQQLIEWWFVHSFSDVWQENLLYTGFYVLAFSFVVPLTSNISRKFSSIIIAALACFLFTFVHICYGTFHKLNADLLMAIMFGGCISYILQILDDDTAELNRMDVLSVGVQLAGITMVKSIGIFWSISAAALYYILRAQRLKSHYSNQRWFTKFRWYDYTVLIPTAAVYVFWRIVCSVLARTTYLVNNLMNAEVISVERHVEQALAFLYAVFFEPAVYFEIGLFSLNLSLAVLIFIPLLFFLYIKKHRTQTKPIFSSIVLYTIGVTVVYLLILLYSFETMFIYEFPADPGAMIDALVRYSTPCIILVRVVLWHTYARWPRKENERRYAGVVMSLILLFSLNTTTLAETFSSAVRGAQEYAPIRAEYEEQYSDFYAQLNQLEDRFNVAVHYFCEDIAEYDRIHLSYLANGTSVILSTYVSPGDVIWNTDNYPTTHAIIYSNGEYTEADYQELMADGTTFEFGKLYLIRDDDRLLEEIPY